MPSSYGVILSLILLLFLATVVTSTEPSLTLVSVSLQDPIFRSIYSFLSITVHDFFFWVVCFAVDWNVVCILVFQANGSDKVDEAPFVPLIEAQKLKTLVMNETRRRLGSFQICALCTCCGGAKGLCLPSPCCYAINCNIPNRPFGFCSFTPKTCNCFGCHY